ncbi:uncharacterized protein LOC113773126 [Coffea eugenioides]|uniref:uncharacterized protein LOC113773126 n=1 Tax=Coffea eugenioides TaxID=49369 RepID=UPI000F613D14|nr:uncharacterized protein LOC113773126 [Coffea eugenioides]
MEQQEPQTQSKISFHQTHTETIIPIRQDQEVANHHFQTAALPIPSPPPPPPPPIDEEKNGNQFDHRFQRTDQWRPVYSWLESLATDEPVKSKDILDWLTENPEVREQLYTRHSRYHLMHYIKKCHMKILKRKEKKMGVQVTHKVHSDDVQTSVETKAIVPVQNTANNLSSLPLDSDLYKAKQKEALQKYEILIDLEKQLLNLISTCDNRPS